MAQPYVGEIRLFAGNFAPAGWLFCDGSLQPISQYETLFNLIGTTYGGDGQSTFALPDLRGRIPVHTGTLTGGGSYLIGELAGVESVTLTTGQTPAHSHALFASTSPAADTSPANNVLAASTGANLYGSTAPTSVLDPRAVSPSGGSQPHNNLMPYLCISFIISLFGIYPSQN